jgi:uncharacterized protein DUF1579
MRFFVVPLAVFAGLFFAAPAFAQPANEPPPPASPLPPELHQLDRFVGTWQSETVSKRTGEKAQEARSKGFTNTMQWVLGGRYLEDRGQAADGSSHIGLWTYEPAEKTYRAWYFSSAGNKMDFIVRWDEKTQAFIGTCTMPNGVTMTTTHYFPDKDTYIWTGVAKDAAGKVYLNMVSTQARKR